MYLSVVCQQLLRSAVFTLSILFSFDNLLVKFVIILYLLLPIYFYSVFILSSLFYYILSSLYLCCLFLICIHSAHFLILRFLCSFSSYSLFSPFVLSLFCILCSVSYSILTLLILFQFCIFSVSFLFCINSVQFIILYSLVLYSVSSYSVFLLSNLFIFWLLFYCLFLFCIIYAHFFYYSFVIKYFNFEMRYYLIKILISVCRGKIWYLFMVSSGFSFRLHSINLLCRHSTIFDLGFCIVTRQSPSQSLLRPPFPVASGVVFHPRITVPDLLILISIFERWSLNRRRV